MVESKKTQMKILAFLLVCVLFIAKAVVTGSHHMSIADAILLYQQECIIEDREPLVTYDDKEEFNETLFRLWDWSDKRILSEEDYRVIFPYIGKMDAAEVVGKYFE